MNGKVIVNCFLVVSPIFMVQPIVSESLTRIVIIPGPVFEYFLVPVDHVLEEIMQVSQQIIREVTIVESIEGQHLTH